MRLLGRWILVLAATPTAATATVSSDDNGLARTRVARTTGTPVPYVVITDRSLQDSFARLAQARTESGLAARVVTVQKIEALYPAGVDLAERIRLFLRDAYANWGTRWVLLGGDATVVPMRRAFLPQVVSSDVFLPTDQYYACLDGSWNADGDDLWGETPRPGSPGDEVDFVPELFVGRAPVRTAADADAFVRRTLDYEARLTTRAPRSALLAAEILGTSFDLAPHAEALRPTLAADPSRSVVRLYENSAAWPGSLHESRPALLDALDGGFDLAVLLGGGGHGVISAGVDPVDHVTAQDLLGLGNAPALGTNAPLYPVVYALSAWTTDPDASLSIGDALLRAPDGGATAVLGSTDVQFVGIAAAFMDQFFDRAVGKAAVPIGEALAGAIAAVSSPATSDGVRLTTQGMLLLGDPALRIDPPGSPGLTAAPREAALRATPGPAEPAEPTSAIAGDPARPHRRTNASREPESSTARGGIEAPSVVLAATALRFALPADATGTYAVDVFDAAGRRVRSLARGTAPIGPFALGWDLRADDGTATPSGAYFVRLSFAGTSVARRLVVLR